VMYLAPKALLRAKAAAGERIPGEPDDERVLSKMIDAPLGDRSKWRPEWPDVKDLLVPIGKARVCREGANVSVVTYGRMVPVAMQAADRVAGDGVDVEVVDLRSLAPYDWDAVKASVRKTRRVLFLNEDTEVTNFGEHLLRRTVEELFYELEAPPKLLAGAHVPGIGLADALERASVPQVDQVATALRDLAKHEP
jgi:2-oxoisovalerate dehydrogenase E1 component beta subunit